MTPTKKEVKGPKKCPAVLSVIAVWQKNWGRGNIFCYFFDDNPCKITPQIVTRSPAVATIADRTSCQ